MHEYFSAASPALEGNIATLESFFDCWVGFNSSEMLGKFISHEHEVGKIKIDGKLEIDVFGDCLKSYSDANGNRSRLFPLNRFILLYAIVVYLQNKSDVSEEQLARRIRIVHNLTRNSTSEISDSENRRGGNRMPAILQQVKTLITEGRIDDSIDKGFNKQQIAEEIEKQVWLEQNPSYQEALFTLEDHGLLRGQISVVGLGKPCHFTRFESLFTCSMDAIDCSLMACGFYPQEESTRWRYQFGSSRDEEAWRSLSHMSSNKGFERTADALDRLLDRASSFSNEILAVIKSEYLARCDAEQSYDFRYYYMKYDCFRPGCFGKYSNFGIESTPYLFSVMRTSQRWSSSTYQPFLKAIEDVARVEVSRDCNGQMIDQGDAFLICANDAYVLKSRDGNNELKRWQIPQNDAGIDTIDRIAYMRGELAASGLEGFIDP